jgi:RNA polymerase sigma-70 factor (sigma-E family)
MDREVELREFVSARGVALSRAAYLLTGDHQSAEDLVQETYVVLVRRWQKSGRVDPEAYVRRILYSRFVDGWRRRRLAELPWATPPDAPGGGDEEGTASDRLTLLGALARLRPQQRAVLVLRFYEDLTETQAAAALARLSTRKSPMSRPTATSTGRSSRPTASSVAATGSWPDSPRRQPSSQSSSACSQSPATPTRLHRSRPVPVPARRPRRPTHPRRGWTPR